jgi:alanyl-tRNA synthetase
MTGFDLPFFRENGFTRKLCPSCNDHFWSQDPDQPNCGDAPCQEYTFLTARFTDRAYTIDEMREAFLGFFEQNDHTRLSRYPVAARWRGDIYLTIASIADFQPHVTSGWVKPPANPLVISQPCIRLNDLDSVGRTGRHLSEFEMLGHHAFNAADDQIYWKNETVKYCHEFLGTIGMSGESYKESTWIGGGNAGACVEVVKGGLEVATLVFMDLKEDPNGTIEVKGKMYTKNPLEIVDTGYGLERFVWASQEKPTIYDALYPSQIATVMEHSVGVQEVDPELLGMHAQLMGLMDIETVGLRGIRMKLVELLNQRGHSITLEEVDELLVPMEKVYTVVDHTRSLAFMLTDDIIPSHNKAGYLARLVLRRTLRIMEDLKIDLSLGQIVDLHIQEMKTSFPEVLEKRDTIMEILELEKDRYRDTIERGTKNVIRIVKDLQKKGATELPVDTLMDFYDTHGLHPTIVQTVSEDAGLKLEIPDEFNNMIAERHIPKVKTAESERTFELPETLPVYYEDEALFESQGTVIAIEGNDIILDRTIFYPEGGGQPNDTGVLLFNNHVYPVVNVQKYNGVIVHTLADGHTPQFTVGDVLTLMIDQDRRQAHRRHHSATHIILEAARRVLGPHIWQTGSYFSDTIAHYDVTHFRRITRDEIKKMELEANRIVLDGHPITKEFLTRDEAEKLYGFKLYQGGAPKVNTIRVVRTGTMDRMIDAEACGGTHVNNTRECGMIKIVRVVSVQDGVERLDYTAGIATVNAVQKMEGYLDDAADNLSVARSHLPGSVNRFFREWKERGKEIQDLKDQLATASVSSLGDSAEIVNGISIVAEVLDMDMKGLQTTVGRILDGPEGSDPKPTLAILGGQDGSILIACSPTGVELNCGTFLRTQGAELGGKGGGRPTLGQGKFPDAEKALAVLKEKAKEALS